MIRSFPKRIGVVWFQGEAQLTKPSFIENVHTWRVLNPDWEVIVLDDGMLREICYRYSEKCGQLYDQFDVMHLKIDFGRYVALWETVSMYVDMDCFAMRSLDRSQHVQEMIRAHGEGADVVALSEMNLKWLEAWLSGNSVNNAVMMASPHHPAIRDLIDAIINDHQPVYRPCDAHTNQTYRVHQTTGPIRFNQFWTLWKQTEKQTHASVAIYQFPYYLFEPGVPYSDYDIRNETVAIHMLDSSWVSPWLKHVAKFYFTCLRPYWLVLLITILIILYLYRRYVTQCRAQCRVLSFRE